MKTLLCSFLALSLLLPVFAQNKLEPKERLNGADILKKFESAGKVLKTSVVDVQDDKGNPVAFATVVSENQFLTKASALLEKGPLQFKLGEKMLKVKRVERPADNDLALFEVEGGGLTPVNMVPAKDFPQGAWLVTSSVKDPGLMAGVKAANERSIKKQRGVIGVYLGADGDEIGGVTVDKVDKDGGAAAAGIRPKDVIVNIEGKEISKRKELQDEIAKHEPGKVLKVIINRDGVDLEKEVLLGHREHVFAQFNSIARISGPTSKRKTGFDRILQHDIPLTIAEMGGPMLNVKGECVGINISRINRSENFALPTEIIQHFLTTTGEKPPQVAGTKDPDPVPAVTPVPVKPPVSSDPGPVKDPMLDINGKLVIPYKLIDE